MPIARSQLHPRQDLGLSLVEVLMGVVISLIFMGTVMQVVMISSVLQATSQERREALNWIQADLETLKFKANRLNWDPVANCYKDPLATCQDQAACRATSSANGFATLLKSRLTYLDPNLEDDTTLDPNDPDNHDLRQSPSSQRTYALTRITTPTNVAPFNVLDVEYAVTPTAGGAAIARLHTAVLPDAALVCP